MIIKPSFITKHLYHKSLLSYLLLPLSLSFSFIQSIRRIIYLKSSKLQYRPNCKIISIGNIVAGGSGKTPLTIFLAKHIYKSGYKVAVSHRGYKGKFENTNKIISNEKGILPDAELAGDEAYLIATKIEGIPVVVGRNRKDSIKLVLDKFPQTDIIILDDSFQHLKVKHDLDFIVFNSIGGVGNGFVLPSGILRESLSSLKFSDICVINGEKSINQLENISKPVIHTKYVVTGLINSNEERVDISDILKSKNILLSGIGLPKSFENTVQGLNIDFVDHIRMPDHYDFNNPQFLRDLEAKIEENEIKHILTTEKDYAKLKFIKHNLPLIIVQVQFELTEISVIDQKIKSLFSE